MQDQNKRGFWGVIIPVEILDSKELGANEKIVYGYVASYTKMCLDSNERIMERLNISERTVQRALQKLQEMGYVYVEYVDNNSAKRRIYAVMDNPKKLAYLVKKGLLKSTIGGGCQNDGEGCQNVTPQNRGEGCQNVTQRIKEEKEEEKSEQKPNGTVAPAVEGPGHWPRCPKRSEFEKAEDFEKALYDWCNCPAGAI